MPEPTSATASSTVPPPSPWRAPDAAPGSAAEERIGVIRWARDDEGIVVLTFDDPDHSANTTNAAFRASLGTIVDRLREERDTVTGVILTSAKATFVTGADLRELVTLGPADRPAAFAAATALKDQLRRLETLGRPVVAALGGAALGGGLEIALACHHRIAADVAGSQLGLPEVTLGLAPSGGGIVRTVRLLGVRSALVNVLLRGQRYSPAQASALGLVDDLVGSVAELLPAARAWIRANPSPAARWDAPGYQIPGGTALAAALPALPATLRRESGGAPAPAGPAILAAAVEGAQVDLATASILESRYFAELVTGPVAKSMIQAFYFDLGRIGSAKGQRPAPPRGLGVLGAGPLGASLAYVGAKAGLDVVLVGSSSGAVARGAGYAQQLVADAVRRGSTRQPTGRALLARIDTAADVTALATMDVIVAAVDADPAVLADPAGPVAPLDLAAAGRAAPTALLCAVSAMPLADGPLVGAAGDGPANVVGLRLSGPADRAPLVEVVAGERTDPAALARAVDLVTRLRKTPIVVHERAGRPGSFVGLLLVAFVGEAVALLAEGVPAASVEQAGTQAGFPTPPLRLLDELSVPAVLAAAAAAGALATNGVDGLAAGPAGDSVLGSRSAAALAALAAAGRPGRAAGAGCYAYTDGRPGRLWSGLRAQFAEVADPAAISVAALTDRLLTAVALAGIRGLDGGVVRTAAEANIGSLTGAGFPAWTGGVLGYVNGFAAADGRTPDRGADSDAVGAGNVLAGEGSETGGPGGFLAHARALEARHGARFAPPASLVDLVARGERYA